MENPLPMKSNDVEKYESEVFVTNVRNGSNLP